MAEEQLMGEERLVALRGATTVDGDTAEAVMGRTSELLATLLERNDVDHDQLVSIIFTSTKDLRSAFPALAARELGLGDVPLLCAGELDVIVAHSADNAVNAADRHNLVADPNARYQLPMLVDPSPLWPDKHEVEDQDEKGKENEVCQARFHVVTSFVVFLCTRTEPLRRLPPAILPPVTHRRLSAEQAGGRAARGQADADMRERRFCRHPPPRSTAQEPQLHQIRLVDILEGVRLPPNRNGQGR